MIAKNINLIVLSIYLILQSSYGDDYTKSILGEDDEDYIIAGSGEGLEDNEPSRPHFTTTFRPDEYPTSNQEFRAHLGGRTELQCSTGKSDGSNLKLIWSRPEGRSLPTNSIQRNGILYIDKVEQEDGGEYKCTGFDSSTRPVFNGNAYLTVIREDDEDFFSGSGGGLEDNEPSKSHYIPTLRPYYPTRIQTFRALLGDRTELQCSIGKSDGSNFEVIWSRPEGRSLPPNSIQRNGVLYIDKVKQDDAGEYKCTGFDSSARPVFNVKAYLTVLHHVLTPAIKAEQNEQQALLGMDVNLRCRVINPSYPTTIRWYREDPPGTKVMFDDQENGEVLYLRNVQKQDQGRYYCELQTRNGTDVDYIDLLVLDPPRITLIPSRQVLHPGDNVHINCSATGEQPIDISWSSLGRDMPRFYAKGGYIQFDNIQLQDAGRYMCVATNRVGRTETMVSLKVQ